MQPDLNRLQARVLAEFLEKGPFKPSAKLLDYRFGPNVNEPICLAIAEVDLEDEKDLYAFCTLPSGSDGNILITLSDGTPDKIAEIIARLADYSRTHSVAFGHTLRLDKEDYMRAAGRVAALLLRVDAIKALSDFPEVITVDGHGYPTHLVVFLDRSEYETKTNQGLVALLDQMDDRGRDLIRFTADERLS